MKPMHARRAAPMVLGILGGLAGGKSTVAGLLVGRGAAVIDADRIGHQVLERPEVRAALCSAFGEQILDKAGRIERRLLAQAAFGSPQSGPQGEPQGVDVLNGIEPKIGALAGMLDSGHFLSCCFSREPALARDVSLTCGRIDAELRLLFRGRIGRRIELLQAS